jgi:hypothetical protein
VRLRHLLGPAIIFSAIGACGEEEADPTIDLSNLNGRWTYQIGAFSGSGRACHSLPATAWSSISGHKGDTTSYFIAIDRIIMVCSAPGVGPDTFPVGSDNNHRVQVATVRYNGDSTVTGCPLPGYVWAVDDEGATKAVLSGAGACGPATAIDGTTLTFAPPLEIAYPQPGGAFATLSGTVTLTRR